MSLHDFEVLDVIIVNFKEFLGVLASLVNLGEGKLLGSLEVLVDSTNTGVEDFDAGQNFLLAEFQLLDLRVEVHLQFVDGGFKEHHLLTLLGEVGLLTLGYLVIVVAFEHEHSKGVFSLLNLVQLILVLVGLVSLLLFEVLDLLLSALALDLTLFPFTFSLSLVSFPFGLRVHRSPLIKICGLAFFLSLAHILHHVILFEIHAVSSTIFSTKERFERLEVRGEEF